MIKTSYDPGADAFAARFAPGNATTAETQEIAPRVMLDFDSEGNVIGVEVVGIRLRLAGACHGPAARQSAAE